MMRELDGTYSYWHPHQMSPSEYDPFDEDGIESNRIPTKIIKDIRSSNFHKKQKCFFKVSTILLTIFIISAMLSPIKSQISQSNILGNSEKSENLNSAVPGFHTQQQTETTEINFIAKDPNYDQTYYEGYLWGQIVQPHRQTSLSLDAGTFSEFEIAMVFWNIDDQVFLEGNEVAHTFTELGKHTIQLTVYSEDGQQSRTLNSKVMCKYVRREVRALTDEDRVEFLDALFTVYSVPTSAGSKMWGPKYKHISYFVDKHLLSSASKECDHWHDNMGLLNTHMAFTLEMEQAMQAVNPRVAMAYWDYMIDYSLYGPRYKRWMKSSKIFDPEYFGAADGGGGVSGKTISDGLWAYYRIAKDAEGLHQNAYGYLRSPWNQNPSPYLERSGLLYDEVYGNTPTCEQFRDMVMADSLGNMIYYATGMTHGLIHLLVGGGWNHPKEEFLQQQNLAGDNLGYAKHLWRTGFSRCPESCEAETAENCYCSVPDEYLDEFGAYNILAEQTSILHWIESKSPGIVYDETDSLYHVLGDYTQAEEEKFWKTLLQALANVGYVGEMFTSASPYDPLFWPLHPTIERGTFWRRLNLNKAPLDETWRYPSEKSSPTNTGYVCDWTHVKGPELPQCKKNTACYGHGQDDIIDFTDFISTSKDKYTNLQYYLFSDPLNPKLPYVYDNYDFNFCENRGISFEFDDYFV